MQAVAISVVYKVLRAESPQHHDAGKAALESSTKIMPPFILGVLRGHAAEKVCLTPQGIEALYNLANMTKGTADTGGNTHHIVTQPLGINSSGH